MSVKKLWWLLPLACLGACANGGNHEKYASVSDSAATSLADTSVEAIALSAPERKIIRTADFRCRVQNVFTAVTGLEALVKSAGGIVQDSRMMNNTGEVSSVNYKPDSLKSVQTYTTTAVLTLKVPSARIDSVIQHIPEMATFIESRTITQNDITTRYLGNQLKTSIGTKVYTPEKGVQLAKKNGRPPAAAGI